MVDPGSRLRSAEGQSPPVTPVPAPPPPCRDWSQLTADLLVSIFASLDVMDLFTAGAVCRSWRDNHLVARRLGSSRRCRNQSPCLLYSSAAGDLAPLDDEATLRALSTGQLRRRIALPNPPLRGRFVVGSSHGWLATADERSDLLVNPLTGAQIALPSPLTIKNVRGRYTADGALHGFDLLELNLDTQDCDAKTYAEDLPLDEGRFYFYVRVAMSGDPSSAGSSCVVVILHMPRSHVSFARVGDTRWTWIDVDWRCSDYSGIFYDDSGSLFYAFVDTGAVHTIDFSGRSTSSPVVKEILVCTV